MKCTSLLTISLIAVFAISCGSNIDHSSPEGIAKSVLKAFSEKDVNSLVGCIDLKTHPDIGGMSEDDVRKTLENEFQASTRKIDYQSYVFVETEKMNMKSDEQLDYYRVLFCNCDDCIKGKHPNPLHWRLEITTYEVDGNWYFKDYYVAPSGVTISKRNN